VAPRNAEKQKHLKTCQICKDTLEKEAKINVNKQGKCITSKANSNTYITYKQIENTPFHQDHSAIKAKHSKNILNSKKTQHYATTTLEITGF